MNSCSTISPQTVASTGFDRSMNVANSNMANSRSANTQAASVKMNASSVSTVSSPRNNYPLWFFFGVAPLAVLTGWSAVGVCLTGNWLWELPLGLVFACAGSMAALVSARLSI